jgi:predicted ester cyclase
MKNGNLPYLFRVVARRCTQDPITMPIRLSSVARPLARALAAAACVAALAPAAAHAASLVEPHGLIVAADAAGRAGTRANPAARRYATFWDAGDAALAQARRRRFQRPHVAGRPRTGHRRPPAASRTMRTAIPDLHCDIEQMIIAGDRVVVHLHFRGHFSGTFNGTAGSGQAIDFIATDIYRVDHGRIAENWHIEDNLTLMRQLGLVG